MIHFFSLGISLYPIHSLGLAGEFCCNFLLFSFILLNMEGVSFFSFSTVSILYLYRKSVYFIFKIEAILKINQQSALLACFCFSVSYFSLNMQLFVASFKTIIFLFSLPFYFCSCRFYLESEWHFPKPYDYAFFLLFHTWKHLVCDL